MTFALSTSMVGHTLEIAIKLKLEINECKKTKYVTKIDIQMG